MIICTAASAATAKELEARTEGLQGLPVEGGDKSWPLIIGKLLFASSAATSLQSDSLSQGRARPDPSRRDRVLGGLLLVFPGVHIGTSLIWRKRDRGHLDRAARTAYVLNSHRRRTVRR